MNNGENQRLRLRKLQRPLSSPRAHERTVVSWTCLCDYGRRTEAQEILTLLISKSREEYVAPLNMARIYAGLGDRSRACEWLEKAYQKGGIHWPFWLMDPMWDSLRIGSHGLWPW
jgi:hypothetical protein